jgi:hypothetical protein
MQRQASRRAWSTAVIHSETFGQNPSQTFAVNDDATAGIKHRAVAVQTQCPTTAGW